MVINLLLVYETVIVENELWTISNSKIYFPWLQDNRKMLWKIRIIITDSKFVNRKAITIKMLHCYLLECQLIPFMC